MSYEHVIVRRAIPEESALLAAISTAVSGTPGSDPSSAIDDRGRLVVVAELDGVIAGWAKTHQHTDVDGAAPAGHYLGGVSVLPAVRRRGVASALVAARLDWIFERANEAWYFTNARNIASIGLHAAFGFAEIARDDAFQGVSFEGGIGILFRLGADEAVTRHRVAG